MVKGKGKEGPPPVDNVISDETGAFDLRFILWRHFCAQRNIAVETLPSQLDGELKEEWEELKMRACARQVRNKTSPRNLFGSR